jgi:hypothetical protein
MAQPMKRKPRKVAPRKAEITGQWSLTQIFKLSPFIIKNRLLNEEKTFEKGRFFFGYVRFKGPADEAWLTAFDKRKPGQYLKIELVKGKVTRLEGTKKGGPWIGRIDSPFPNPREIVPDRKVTMAFIRNLRTAGIMKPDVLKTLGIQGTANSRKRILRR